MASKAKKSSKARKDVESSNGEEDEIHAINIPIKSDDGLFLSALHPKYLHTNSTSHTWPFSAVAELIDNAYDPDVNASQLFIDLKTFKNQERSLVFTDNGNGMSPNKIYKMLSFGFCEKVAVNDHLPVGHYGNGFKSGSMRLGKDALVFTKTESRWSLGFLSQTYLQVTASDTIIVPIATWDPKKFTLLEGEMGGKKSLSAILEHSVMSTSSDIQQEFQAIEGTTGTRIVISNLRKQASGNKFELDFTKDHNDIRIPDDLADSDESKYKREQRQDHIPASDYSLRAYCSILYLKPRMQILLRGKKVKTTVVAKSLAMTEVDTYRPYTPSGYSKPVKIVFGFSQNRNHYGIMMYHRNRLIKPYVRVGHQEKQNNLGIGVIGVIECDFLQPTHNKQDFDYTKAFRACMMGLGRKLNEYWQEKKTAKKNQPQQVAEETEKIVPDQKWVQCDNPQCLKWRILPDSVDLDTLPDKWYCKDHPLPEWRSCDIAETLEVEDKNPKPYTKEVKRQLEKEKKQKRQSSSAAAEKSSSIIEMAEKNKKELEIEKKKRLINEQKAKEQEAEIKRLQLELQKSTSVSPSPSKQGGATTPAKQATQPKSASTTPVKSEPVSTTPTRITRQTTKKTPTLVAVSPNPDSTTKSTAEPTPTKPTSVQTIATANTATSTTAVSTVPASPLKYAVIQTSVANNVPSYPTRQSINQAIKVRLPYLGGKKPLPIAPSPNGAVRMAQSPAVTTKAVTGQQPSMQKQITTVTKIINTAGSPVKFQAKPGTVLSRNIRLTPAQVNQSISSLTTGANTLPKQLLTVVRLNEPGKHAGFAAPRAIGNVTPKTTGGATMQSGTLQLRPTVPGTAVLRFGTPTQVAQVRSPAKTPVTATLRLSNPSQAPQANSSANSQFKSTVPATLRLGNVSQVSQVKPSMSSTNRLKSPASSHDISQQLAQIGIDAILHQATQDIKPTMVKTAPVPRTQAVSTPVVALANRSMILTNNLAAVNNYDRSNGETVEKQSQPSALKRKPDPDVIIVGASAPKQVKKESLSPPKSVPDPEKSVPNSRSETPKTKPNNNENSNQTVKDTTTEIKLEIPPDILKVTDKEVIAELNKLPHRSVLGILAQRSQQLKDLRQSVCKLLGVLVPDLDLPETGSKSLEDNTIDALLKDVLDANMDSAKSS